MAKQKFDIYPTLEDIFSPLKAKSGTQIKSSKKATPITRKQMIGYADDGLDLTPLQRADVGATGPQDTDLLFGNVSPRSLNPIGRADIGAKGPNNVPEEFEPSYNPSAMPQAQGPQGKSNKKAIGQTSNMLLGAASILDAAIPYGRIRRQQVIRPPFAYNQNPYGTGSQATMASGGIIYNPPFHNFMAQNVAEDRAGAPRHYYHSDDDYYEGGGPIQIKEPVSTTYHRIPTPNLARRPNGQVINPSYEFMTPKATGEDSTQYRRGFYNSINRLKTGQLPPFEDKAFFFGDFNSAEANAHNPNLDTPGAPDMFNRGAREAYMNSPKGSFDDGGAVQGLFNVMGNASKQASDAMGDMAKIAAFAKSGKWIQGAVNPEHKGYCTPMTKSTCTPRRKAFAKTMKKHHGFHKKSEEGDEITVDQNNIPTITHRTGKGSTPRYTKEPVYNLLNTEDVHNPIPSRKDSLSYLQHYNEMRRDMPGNMMEYLRLQHEPDLPGEQGARNENKLSAYEDALSPGTMTLFLPKDVPNPPKKVKKGDNGAQFGGYKEPTPSKYVNQDNAANLLTFAEGGELAWDERNNLLVFGQGGELERDQKDNLLVWTNGGELGQDERDNVQVWGNGGCMDCGGKVRAKYGYRIHQDETRNRPTFDDGGYIKKLNSNGKVIPNILASGDKISPAQRRSDKPYNQMTYYEPDLVAASGAIIDKEQAKSDYPYNQGYYMNKNGGIIPSTYGKDEDMNLLVFAAGGAVGLASAPGFAGHMAARTVGGASDTPYKRRKKMADGGALGSPYTQSAMPGGKGKGGGMPNDKKRPDNKGGRMIAFGLGGPAMSYKNGKYADSFDDNMLLTAEYADGGTLTHPALQSDRYNTNLNPDHDFVERNKLNKAQKAGVRGKGHVMRTGGDISASKAAEILHDGTAHGHPLTDRQRRFMGAKANQMPGGGTIGGEGPFTQKNIRASETQDNRDFGFIDHVNYALSTGKPFKGAWTGDYTPEQRQILNGAYIWRAQNPNKSNEDMIQSYFNRPITGNSPVDQYRMKLRTMGYGPVTRYYDTPNVRIQALQGNKGGQTQIDALTANFDNGGKVDVNKIIPHPLKFHYGGDAEITSDNPYAGPTLEFKGPSHEEGGIGMSYAGKKVEVEGGETGVVDQDGDFNVMGNMNFPGSSKKFKSVSKDIADMENSANRKFKKGQKLMDNANPNDAYDYLRFNSGRALTIGADMRLKKLANAREQLGDIQKTMLDTADRMGIDPQDFSQGVYTKAKYGKRIKGDSGIDIGGDPDKPATRADRNHNPGNIKYGPWAKAHGATGQDKEGFAVFDSDDIGSGAMSSLLQSNSYNNLSVKDAINKWTANKPYDYDLGDLANKRVGALSTDEFGKVINTMKQGEGTRYGLPRATTTTPRAVVPGTNPAFPSNNTTIKYNPNNPVNDQFHRDYDQVTGDDQPLPDLMGDPGNPPSSARYNKLDFTQIAPELYSVATNRQIPVPAQFYRPQLLQPYKVSFQDRINENRESFSAMAKALDYNPAALSTLGAQKYNADNAVHAEEFRTNQAISQEIANKNTEILNDAQLKNLQIADQQMVRQAQARAKTKAQYQEALNSVASKSLQNALENRKLQLYEGLFDYRFDDTDGDGKPDAFVYEGAPASFDFSGRGRAGGFGSNDGYGRETVTRDANGNVKSTRTTSLPSIDEQLKEYRLMKERQRVYRPIQ